MTLVYLRIGPLTTHGTLMWGTPRYHPFQVNPHMWDTLFRSPRPLAAPPLKDILHIGSWWLWPSEELFQLPVLHAG